MTTCILKTGTLCELALYKKCDTNTFQQWGVLTIVHLQFLSSIVTCMAATLSADWLSGYFQALTLIIYIKKIFNYSLLLTSSGCVWLNWFILFEYEWRILIWWSTKEKKITKETTFSNNNCPDILGDSCSS